jgi:hypothetical protein
LENLKEKDHLGDLDVDENYINVDERVWIGLKWLRIGPIAGSSENDNHPSGSVK